MVAFCKTPNCPSSQQLLAFENNSSSNEERGKIQTHLSECEFCAAEVEFYAHYPQAEEPVAKVEMPAALYELAEALLGNKHENFLAINKLLCENEGVKI